AYVLAKLLWDPSVDAGDARDEYLDAVYGPAATAIRTYLDALDSRALVRDVHAHIYDGVDARWLDAAWQGNADQLFEEAETAVRAQPDYPARVRAARLSVDYPAVERARAAGRKDDPESILRARRFLANAAASGLTAVREGDAGFDAYRQQVE